MLPHHENGFRSPPCIRKEARPHPSSFHHLFYRPDHIPLFRNKAEWKIYDKLEHPFLAKLSKTGVSISIQDVRGTSGIFFLLFYLTSAIIYMITR